MSEEPIQKELFESTLEGMRISGAGCSASTILIPDYGGSAGERRLQFRLPGAAAIAHLEGVRQKQKE